MRYFYRMLRIIVALTAIGSFLIALTDWVSRNDDKQSELLITPEAKCDWSVYQPAVRKMRSAPKPDDIERFAWLGADSRFNYFYDYVADDVMCTLQLKPNGPLVHPSRKRKTNRTKENVILFSVLVIAFSGVGLMIIKLFR